MQTACWLGVGSVVANRCPAGPSLSFSLSLSLSLTRWHILKTPSRPRRMQRSPESLVGRDRKMPGRWWGERAGAGEGGRGRPGKCHSEMLCRIVLSQARSLVEERREGVREGERKVCFFATWAPFDCETSSNDGISILAPSVGREGASEGFYELEEGENSLLRNRRR
jgi:hypothetical protein